MNALMHVLQRVDGSAPAIQAAAGELMKHYGDGTAATAVLEWRNALFQARADQILPLLYVANEVMQNSKRNRGSKYLEAFSPILPQSLEYMAQQLPESVEKIRRTVKIWGDRHTLSIRFINDILHRLEPYRDVSKEFEAHAKLFPNRQMSPLHYPSKQKEEEVVVVEEKIPQKPVEENDDDDDILQIMDGNDRPDEEDEDMDDVDLFGSSDEPKLEIDVNFGDVAIATGSTTTGNNNESTTTTTTTKPPSSSRTKRRRSSGGPGSANNRRPSLLSSTNMVDLWKQLSVNQQDVDLSIKTLKDLQEKAKKEAATVDISTLVGDKLQQAVKVNHMDKLTILKYRRRLFSLANERRDIEQQAIRYYHWIAQSIHTDVGDLDLADTVETKLVMWAPVAERLTMARTARREQESEIAMAQELQRHRQREAAEAAAFRAAALAKETEAKPGMVWNPTTREYQALNTDESWRD